jgi:ABC-2 type transport system ATP-binding protein
MIDIEHLHFRYGRKSVYDDLSLSLSQPGVYGLFGRNGSGKSTLLKIMSGLLFPTSGVVNVLGFTPKQRRPDFLEQIYILPEEFHLPNISLATLEKTHAPFYPHFSRSDFESHVQTFELSMTDGFEAMSLGQRKKAVLAFALATHTPVLLMDEPTNGLDIMGRSQFKSIMARPSQRQRLVVISTHQAHDLESLMHYALFVDAGKLELSADMKILQSALRTGVVESLAEVPTPIYKEQQGQHWAYVVANESDAPGAIQLELLYKALSVNKTDVLAAVTAYTSKQELRT